MGTNKIEATPGTLKQQDATPVLNINIEQDRQYISMPTFEIKASNEVANAIAMHRK